MNQHTPPTQVHSNSWEAGWKCSHNLWLPLEAKIIIIIIIIIFIFIIIVLPRIGP